VIASRRGGSWIAVSALAILLLTGPVSRASTMLWAGQYPPSRPLDGTEVYEKLVDESDLLLIARLVHVDATATAQPLPGPGASSDPSDLPSRRRSILEPVAWLRGGIDGDRIEVIRLEGGLDVEMPPRPAWSSAAGVDSLGVLVRLKRLGTDWQVPKWDREIMAHGFRVLPQRTFLAVRDSVLHARDRLDIDSLTARADLIIVTADSVEVRIGKMVTPGRVNVARVIKGTLNATTLALQPWRSFHCEAGAVLFLRSIGTGHYEPLPMHRTTPMEFDLPEADKGVGSSIESAVRAALTRLAILKEQR
jgi:hypothetical protein